MSHSITPNEDMFYVVAMTPEDAPTNKPVLATLCEYHYLMACSCLMIRRVLAVRSRECVDMEPAECKFCS